MKNNHVSRGGVGICTVIFLILLVLKLTKLITISWWWVFAPYWIPFLWYCIVVLLIVLFGKSLK